MIIKIGKKQIGAGNPCFIIAEAGVNHNGSLKLALELVDKAAEVGADAIKFQTFKAEQVATESGEMASYQKKNLGVVESQREMLRKLELKEEFYAPILKQCKKRGLIFLSTPHGGKESVDFLESIGVDAYKIGSGDLNNFLVLDKIARLKKPIILGTGMATLKEVQQTEAFIRSRGNNKIVMLHCTTNYPCPPEEVNLAAMVTMQKNLRSLVGYSDHTEGPQVAIMAATFGAVVYEGHFTLDKSLPGPDHVASADPKEFKMRVDGIRNVPIIMGKSKKEPTKDELNSMIPTVRKSLLAARDLSKGHVLTYKDLEAKRPGKGVPPSRYEEFIGKKLKHDLEKDQQINKSDINH